MFIGIVKFKKPKGLIKVFTTRAYSRPLAKAKIAEYAGGGELIERVWAQKSQPSSTIRTIWSSDQQGSGGARKCLKVVG